MNRYLLLLRLSVALALILAFGSRGPTFYSLLRVATAFAAIEAMWLAILQRKRPWILAFGFVAVLWNPLWPLRMDKQAWQLLNVAAAFLFSFSVPLLHADSLLPRLIWRPSRRWAFGAALAAAIATGLVYVAATYPRVPAKSARAHGAGVADRKQQDALTAFDRAVRTSPPEFIPDDEVPTSPPKFIPDDAVEALASPPIYFDDNGNPIPPGSSPKALDTRYDTLIRVRRGRIVRSDYDELGSARRKLLELRLEKASRAGDPVAQQALRDIDSWTHQLKTSGTTQ